MNMLLKILFVTFFTVLSVSKSKITDWEIPELQYLNKTVNPCDNFYEFACGNFENVKPRPKEESLWDSFVISQKQLHLIMKDILELPSSPDDPVALSKARAAFKACMDVDYADQLLLPEKSILLGRNGDWPLISQICYPMTPFDWNTIGKLIATYGIHLFFQVEVMPNLFDSTQNIIYISQDKLLNPAIHPSLVERPDDYLQSLRSSQIDKKHPYELFLNKIAIYLRNAIGSFKSEELIQKEVSEILRFMKLLHQGGINSSQHNATSTLKTVETLQQWTDTEVGDINLNWLTFLNTTFSRSGVKVTKDTKVLIMNTSVFYGVLNLIKNTDPIMLKNFAMSRIFTYTAPDSIKGMRNAYKEYHHDMGYNDYSRSDYCTRKILNYPGHIGFAFALTHEYQKKYFDKQAIYGAAELTHHLIKVFEGTLKASDWIDEETTIKAIEKINNMITLLGYPEFIKDPRLLDKYYENVRICTWDHFGNSQRLRALALALNLALLNRPRNREVWQLSPLEVNAFYNAQNNRVILPVGLLNMGFYSGIMSALDYGRLGVIIGHEITHGFDNNGMLYDANGTFTPGWWSQQTKSEYNKRKICFEEQYGEFLIPEINEYVNATKTLRENIADNGGLREAFQAFQELETRKYTGIENLDGYTPEQLFFIGYGTLWCTLQTKEYLRYSVSNSNYPPAMFRVIGAVSNSKEFSRAFNCPIGSKMNPQNKCILW